MRANRGIIVTLAAGLPLVVSAILSIFRESIAQATAALVLVLIVVAASATGDRLAGIVAALSSVAWFDFFLTEPYNRFTIDDPNDTEATILLVVIGLAVNELALWGRRQQADASRRAGYLNGVLGTAEIISGRVDDPEDLTRRIASQISEVLDVDECRYVAGPIHDPRIAIIDGSGAASRDGRKVAVPKDGLPTDMESAIQVRYQGEVVGHFRIVSSTRIARPSAEQLRVAVLLADQAAPLLRRS